MASKTGQITVKKSVVELLDRDRFPGNEGLEKSYSEVIEELYKIKKHSLCADNILYVEQEKNKLLLERIEVLRLAKRKIKGGKNGNSG